MYRNTEMIYFKGIILMIRGSRGSENKEIGSLFTS